MSTVTNADYLRILERWPKSAMKYLHVPSGRPDLECYGTGYNGWGSQTHQKAFAAFAVLSQDPGFDCKNAGISRDELLDHSLKQLRFSLESHIEGSFNCLDGTSWGHTWISALGTERMMHAVDALEPHLTDADRDLLRNVLISESDWLLDEYEIVGDPDASTGKNKPESNLWNGAILHRTAMMYPDAPRANEYREKGSRFLINSISVPSDSQLKDIIDGKAISEWHIGGNFFESYALHHHSYLNVGYMVICLSNLAMLHFAYRQRGIKAPEALYHHAYDLWKVIKMCTFPDGRLLRIGGDTRARYCYCQDYAIPTWLFLEDYFGETDCLKFEAGWLKTITQEIDYNGDGSFLRKRLDDLHQVSPLYYTRLESDRAATFSMGGYWRRIFNNFTDVSPKSDQAVSAGAWSDTFHGACLQRSDRRITSWVWEAAEKPQGLCLPVEGSDLAEWRMNLAGQINGIGKLNYGNVLEHTENMFEGGFITYGTFQICSDVHIGEGQKEEILAQQQIVFAALPDDTTVVGLQYAESLMRVYLNAVKGIKLQVPNDIYNGSRREYVSAEGKMELNGCPVNEEIVKFNSKWITVDDRLAVVTLYGDDGISLYRSAGRKIELRFKPEAGGTLYVDEICCPCNVGRQVYDADSVLLDCGFAVQCGRSGEEIRSSVEKNEFRAISDSDNPTQKSVVVKGTDGNDYVLIANFGKEEITVDTDSEGTGSLADLVTGEKILPDSKNVFSCLCHGGSARLFRRE